MSTTSDALSYFAFVMFFGLPIAYIAALIVGLPVYFLIRNSKFETAMTCVIITAIITSLVYFFLEVDIFPSEKSSSASYGDSGGDIVKDNVRTAYGWKTLLIGMSQIFILGAISGLLFWRLYSGKWWGRIRN